MVSFGFFFFFLLQFFYFFVANNQYNGPGYSKHTINKTPPYRHSANITCYQSKRNNKQAGNDPEFNYPFIFNRISIWSYKKNSKHKMGKCKPVISIKQKRVIFASL